MNMVTALMCSAVGRLNDQVIALSLFETTRELIKLCNMAKEEFLHAVLKKEKLVCSVRLDSRSLPAAVWTAICLQQPRLQYYPLGEIAERAVKKMVISLILKTATSKSADDSLNLADREIAQQLGSYSRKELLQCFLSHYFFEICIDYMRRPRVLSRRYNFSKKDRMVSLEAERKLRGILAEQCETSAKKFLPFQLEALNEKSPAFAAQRIKKGFVEVFGVVPLKWKKGHNQNEHFVNVIVGTRSAAHIKKSFTLDKKVKRFLFHAKHPNVSVSFDTLKCWLGRSPHSLIKDLIDMGVAVYMSDLYTKRGHDLARRIGIFMPVRHPDIWYSAKRKVERTVASLGRDDVRIHFVKRKERSNPVEFSIKSDKRCVCLFSGGLDSMAGAVWALDNGLTPVFVSHYANNQLAHIQKSLVNELEKIYDQKLQHLYFHVGKSKSKKARYRLSMPPRSIMAQHLRSFLFLSLATAVALESGIGKVYIFENGPIALNPLFSEARINTHTAHPHFLTSFQTMIKSIFGIELQIKNPFAYMTKGEVATILAKPKVQNLVKATNSCWNWFKIPLIAKNRNITWRKESHDGNCLPCILRRIAIHRAGLWENDAQYLTDIFAYHSTYGKSGDTFKALADFIRFCRNVKSLSDVELLLYAPDFSVYEEGTDGEELVQMYREHAEEVIRCFRAKSMTQLRKVFASMLF